MARLTAARDLASDLFGEKPGFERWLFRGLSVGLSVYVCWAGMGRLGRIHSYAVAITGGSGKYKSVEGEVRVIPATEAQPRES